ICIAWTHDTARATDCERRLLGDVERDGCLYRRHDRQLERHRVQGELVDAGRQPFDPQRRAGQRPAVDEPRQLLGATAAATTASAAAPTAARQLAVQSLQ